MRVVVQRVTKASVSCDQKIVAKIDFGLLVLVGFTYDDSSKDIDYLVDKILNLRIFDDENGVMNRSVLDINGSILSVSQFTLYADTKKGRRPSYHNALKNSEAKLLYDEFNSKLKDKIDLKTGVFGGDMDVEFLNQGPVTIIMESR